MGRYLIAAALSVAALLGQEFKLGSKVEDFTLRDTSGGEVQFRSLRGPVTVVVFIATKCPVSNAYNDRMNAIYKDYSQRGVKFVFVNANSTEPLEEVAQHARDHFVFRVYKDWDDVVADRFGASVTPEAFVIDATGTIRYHGSIDDSQVMQRVQQNRLRNALDAVLEDKPVAEAETKAFGCSIKRVRKAS
ncbi:MAG: redoxin domain-containing protein [Bryobacteraceae bacterium]|jgi:peroxiredoxin